MMLLSKATEKLNKRKSNKKTAPRAELKPRKHMTAKVPQKIIEDREMLAIESE